MKKIYWALGILAVLLASFGILERFAAERVEVVELHTLDRTGQEVVTRLWVVDDEGLQYLRVGAGGSGWFDRLQASEVFGLTRNGVTRQFTSELREDKQRRINSLMRIKYTWGDVFFATFFGGREGSIPVELHPVPDDGLPVVAE